MNRRENGNTLCGNRLRKNMLNEREMGGKRGLNNFFVSHLVCCH
jgi:hypothetical protein